MTTYTGHHYTKPQEHTLYPLPSRRLACCECLTAGYWYPAAEEVWYYTACIWRDRVHTGDQHVWVLEGTLQTQGTGDYAFPETAPPKHERYAR